MPLNHTGFDGSFSPGERTAEQTADFKMGSKRGLANARAVKVI